MITTTCLATLWLFGAAEAGNNASVEARRELRAAVVR